MKVLVLNGSPRVNGNTSIAIREACKALNEEGIDTEVISIGKEEVSGCKDCGACGTLGKCVHDDLVNVVAEKFKEADGLIVGSPVYYASANGTLISLLDRLFTSTNFDKTMKVGASIVCARRGGCSATFDELNKYFTITGMPVVSSQYWNSIHGGAIGEAEMDLEGKQIMRTLGKNMAFLIKSIALGKKEYGLPQKEEHLWTSFIR